MKNRERGKLGANKQFGGKERAPAETYHKIKDYREAGAKTQKYKHKNVPQNWLGCQIPYQEIKNVTERK